MRLESRVWGSVGGSQRQCWPNRLCWADRMSWWEGRGREFPAGGQSMEITLGHWQSAPFPVMSLTRSHGIHCSAPGG